MLLWTVLFIVFLKVSALGSAPGETACCCPQGDHDGCCGQAQEVDVVVVGGGVAGLTALNTLLQHNVTSVVLLEAQDRLGGRVRTFRQGGVLVEDGAEWIHGDRRNPLHRLARSLGALDTPTPDDAWDFRLVTEEGEDGDEATYDKLMSLMEETNENGVLEPYYNMSYGYYFLDRFREVFPANTPRRDALLHLLEQTVNYMEGTGSWEDIAAQDADQYIDHGENFQWADGYDTLIDHLKAKIPGEAVRLSSPVTRVSWSCPARPSQARVVTQGGQVFLARHVLVTVSAAYLQLHHDSLFQPPLPAEFLKKLSGVKLGVANKVQLGWPEPWWGPRPLELTILWTKFDLPQNMSWLHGVVSLFSVHRQRAVLELFVTGSHSSQMEALEEDEVKAHVTHLLRRVSGQDVPEPTFFRRTRWGSDPWTLGSYSTFVTMEGNKAGLRRRSQLATPLKNSTGHTVLLWAGEHTHNTRYSTVDGAMETGQREARRIAHLLKAYC